MTGLEGLKGKQSSGLEATRGSRREAAEVTWNRILSPLSSPSRPALRARDWPQGRPRAQLKHRPRGSQSKKDVPFTERQCKVVSFLILGHCVSYLLLMS